MLKIVTPIRYILMIIALFGVTARLLNIDSEIVRHFIQNWLDFVVRDYLMVEALYWAIKFRLAKQQLEGKAK